MTGVVTREKKTPVLATIGIVLRPTFQGTLVRFILLIGSSFPADQASLIRSLEVLTNAIASHF